MAGAVVGSRATSQHFINTSTIVRRRLDKTLFNGWPPVRLAERNLLVTGRAAAASHGSVARWQNACCNGFVRYARVAPVRRSRAGFVHGAAQRVGQRWIFPTVNKIVAEDATSALMRSMLEFVERLVVSARSCLDSCCG
jgi:hypothetical protein